MFTVDGAAVSFLLQFWVKLPCGRAFPYVGGAVAHFSGNVPYRWLPRQDRPGTRALARLQSRSFPLSSCVMASHN